MQILTIARLTIKEASRRKLLVALLVITAAVIGLTVWGFSRLNDLTIGVPPRKPSTTEIRLITSQLLILVMFAYSFVLALSAVFMATPSVAGELESGVALSLLTRPISRSELLLGKWLGMAVMTTAYVGGASAVEFLLVNFVTGYAPPHPLEFVAYLVGETLVILTIAMLLSTRVPSIAGGVTALGLFLMAWLGGIALAIGQAFDNPGIITAGTISRLILPTDGLWRGALYSLEPVAFITATNQLGRVSSSNPFFAGTGPPAPYLSWAVGWVVVMLALATWSFRTREV